MEDQSFGSQKPEEKSNKYQNNMLEYRSLKTRVVIPRRSDFDSRSLKKRVVSTRRSDFGS